MNPTIVDVLIASGILEKDQDHIKKYPVRTYVMRQGKLTITAVHKTVIEREACIVPAPR